ncbi:hypothetical protein FACS189447_04560 [Spirochaetia bacterium]|nr:hypothetical protein FACS189447_04560 [Spirochaetia bacterium]
MSTISIKEKAVKTAGNRTNLKGTGNPMDLEVTNGEKVNRGVFSQETAENITARLTEAMNLFAEFGNTYTPHDRLRLIGAGIKNWGFIQTSFSHAEINPQFVPEYLDIAEFKGAIDGFERKRILLTMIKQLARIVSDSMLNDSDTAYHDGVEYYNYVREAARQRVPGAHAEYESLRPYFKHSKRTAMGNINHGQTEFSDAVEG